MGLWVHLNNILPYRCQVVRLESLGELRRPFEDYRSSIVIGSGHNNEASISRANS
jgi:hypothetical protein